jgi:hypothetical protein
MQLKYQWAAYLRPSLTHRLDAALRVYPEAFEDYSNDRLGFAIVAQEHRMDWSDEGTPSEHRGVGDVIDMFFQTLNESVVGGKQALAPSEIPNKLLNAFQVAHGTAETLQIAASVLIVAWIEGTLNIASVGGCRAYLVRNGRSRQLNIDDYVRMTLDGTPHTSETLLSNALGLGNVHSTDDIHLLELSLEPDDLLILCNKAFYKNMPDEVIQDHEASTADIDKLCISLGMKAVELVDAVDPVSLCLVRFQ